MIKSRVPSELQRITFKKEYIFEIHIILMRIAIVDGILSQSEAGYFFRVGRLLRVDIDLVKQILS